MCLLSVLSDENKIEQCYTIAMKIEQIETFIAAVESDTFFTAEGSQHRLISSASKDILDLEEELGTVLFIRKGTDTGILSDAGKVFLNDARSLMREYHMMMTHIEPYRTKDDNRIVIGTLPILRQYRLHNFFQRFVDEHQDSQIFMEESEGKSVLNGLDNGYYDAVIVRKHMIHDDSIKIYPLASDELAAILWQDHPFAKQTSITLDKLRNENIYLANPYSSSFGIAWNLLKKNHISTENVYTSSADQLLPAVASKQGITLLPVSSLTISKQEGVVAIPLRPKAAMEVVFAIKKDESFSPVMQDLIKMVKIRGKSVPQL